MPQKIICYASEDNHAWWSYMISMDDDHAWWSCMMIMHDDHAWWSWMMIMDDDHAWWSWIMIMDSDHAWWSSLMIIHDNHIWWSYMMIMYDDHIWKSYMMIMMIMYDDHVWRKCWWTFSVFDLCTNMLGEVWGMFWHHHYCLGNHLEPISINISSNKIFRSKKARNNLSVILPWSDNSKDQSGVEFFTFSFLYYFLRHYRLSFLAW